MREEIRDLRAAMAKAAVYFDNPINTLLQESWDVFATMRRSHDAYVFNLASNTIRDNFDRHMAAYNDVYGGVQIGRLATKQAEVRKLLTPIARLNVVE